VTGADLFIAEPVKYKKSMFRNLKNISNIKQFIGEHDGKEKKR